jgi:hypothetical protein
MSEKVKPCVGPRVTDKSFGPAREELARIGDRAMTLESVRKYIGCDNVRRLYVKALDDEDKGTKAPSRFRLTLYDDTNHRAIFIDGSLRNPRRVDITESALPPHPSDREFAEAVKIVRDDAAFAAAIDARQLEAYQPIPALALNELPDGRIERRIAVGLRPRNSNAQHEIVAVDLARQRVIRFEERQPPNVRLKRVEV